MTKTESYRWAETCSVKRKVCLLLYQSIGGWGLAQLFIEHKYGARSTWSTGLTEQTPLLSRQRGNARMARRDPIVWTTYDMLAWCFSLAMHYVHTRYSDSPDGFCAPVSVWRMVEQSNDDRRAAHDDDQIIRVINPSTGFPRRGNLCWSYFTG